MANTSGKVTYWWYKQQKLWGSGLDYFTKKVQASDLRTPGQVGPKCFSERSALAPANWCATLVWIQEVLHTSVDNLSFFQPKMGHDQLDLLKSHSKGFFHLPSFGEVSHWSLRKHCKTEEIQASHISFLKSMTARHQVSPWAVESVKSSIARQTQKHQKKTAAPLSTDVELHLNSLN